MIGLLLVAQVATATPDMGAPPETPEHKVERLSTELRAAQLELAAARVNRGIEKRRRAPR